MSVISIRNLVADAVKTWNAFLAAGMIFAGEVQRADIVGLIARSR